MRLHRDLDACRPSRPLGWDLGRLRSRPCAGWPADAPATCLREHNALASFVETPRHGNDRGVDVPGEGSIRTDLRQWPLSPEELSKCYVGFT
jgi:hypothetical protein